MARMIPETISGDIRSNAEKRIFEILRALGSDDWVCLHSLGLARHSVKRRAEIDFVILTPKAIFVLEVKGGRVSRRNGYWTHTDREGREHTTHQSPFDQAASAMFALERDVREHFGRNHRLGNLRYCYGVLFPDIEFDSVGTEADRSLVYDVRDRRLQFSSYLDRLLQFSIGHDSQRRFAPNQSDIAELVEFLRGDFDIEPTLEQQVEAFGGRLVHLSWEQAQVLHAYDPVPRLLVEGAAGTGKTLLAIETAKRDGSSKRTLFLCYNRFLAASLSYQLRDLSLSKLEVKSVYGFLKDMILRSSLREAFQRDCRVASPQELYEKVFPDYAALALCEPWYQPFDSLIVDEAQDILTQSLLDVLDHAIAGGLEAGRWRFFFDANNQGAIFGVCEPSALKRLQTFGQRTLLVHNRRNSRQISNEVEVIAAPAVRPIPLVDGPPVNYVWYTDSAERAEIISRQLAQFAGEGIIPGKVTILSCRKEQDEPSKHGLKDVVPLTEDNVGDVVAGKATAVTYSTVSAFKGLENDFIILLDIDNLGTAWWKSVIYVGMSRARFGLTVLMSRKLEADYQKALRSWMETQETQREVFSL